MTNETRKTMKTLQKLHATAIKNPSGIYTVFLNDTPSVVVQAPTLKDATPKLIKLLVAYNNYMITEAEDIIEFETQALA